MSNFIEQTNQLAQDVTMFCQAMDLLLSSIPDRQLAECIRRQYGDTVAYVAVTALAIAQADHVSPIQKPACLYTGHRNRLI